MRIYVIVSLPDNYECMRFGANDPEHAARLLEFCITTYMYQGSMLSVELVIE